jgi:GPH family glycoside/pentoside/hexuronide:cation symporter
MKMQVALPSSSQKLSLRERVSYGFGDLASSMFWKLFSMFLLFFYTDVFGISAAAVGTMFLVTRIWDSANDPLMGIIADRTQTRWGKFRPYLLFVAIPFAIIGILTFTTPDLGESGKLVYAYVTYTLMMMVYTAINVPYASLLGVMTHDTGERTTLASWRFIGGYSGGLFVTATANSLVEYLSAGGDVASGYQKTITLYAILAAVFFILTFAGTKERLKPAVEKSPSIRDDVRDLLANGPWLLMLGAGISILIFNSLRDAAILYYFKYYVGDQTVLFLGETSQGTLASAFMTTLLGASIVGVVLAKPVSARIGKKQTFILSGLVCTVLSVLFFFLPPERIGLIFLVNILTGAAAGIVLPLIWAMYADVADYSEWKHGRRATGLIFSSSSMSQKIGWTVGGAISGWLLAAFGFEANVAQTGESLLGIRLMISVFAAGGALLSVAFLLFYPLDEATMQEIDTELQKARGGGSE